MIVEVNEAFLIDCITTAKRAAKSAEQIIKHYYKCSPDTQIKQDMTPVTQADLECEQVIKQVLATQFPEFGFYGEETGMSENDSEFLWLVDPIDGTKSFVREYGFFSTQIALMYKNEIIMGLSHAPLFNETAWAARNMGAYINDERVYVSDFTEYHENCFSTGNLKSLTNDVGSWEKLRTALSLASKTRGYGDFYHYHLLAAGKLELVIESDVNILDIAALSILVKEANGLITDLDGKEINLETTTILAGNKANYTKVLDIFNND
jgi:histidinol-phosphatase